MSHRRGSVSSAASHRTHTAGLALINVTGAKVTTASRLMLNFRSSERCATLPSWNRPGRFWPPQPSNSPPHRPSRPGRRFRLGMCLEVAAWCWIEIGATGENRTPDQPFTRGQLYQLSYGGSSCSRVGVHNLSGVLSAKALLLRQCGFDLGLDSIHRVQVLLL